MKGGKFADLSPAIAGHPNRQGHHGIFKVSGSTCRAAHRQFDGLRVLGVPEIFYLLPMDQAEINNWKAIAESMEAKGDTESWFYLRARAIADGKPDPMPNVSELMGGSAA